MKDNTLIGDSLILAGISTKSSRYPLFLSYRDIPLDDIPDLIRSLSDSYSIDLLLIRKSRGRYSD